jgi:hypothetical protein
MDNPNNDPQPSFVNARTIGPRGPEGVQGTPGERGIQGPQGRQGPEGDRGVRGEPGAPGRTGPDGLRGAVGQPVYWDEIMASFAENSQTNDEVFLGLSARIDAFYEDFKRLIVIIGGGTSVGVLWYLLRTFVS